MTNKLTKKTNKKLGKRPNKESLGITYRGVSVNTYRTQSGWGVRLRSRIQKNGERFHLGCFLLEDAVAAAKAYNDGARKHYTTRTAKKLGYWNEL